VRLDRDLTFRDIDPLPEMVTAASPSREHRLVTLPPGTRPGFLVALRDVIAQHQFHPSAHSPRAGDPGPCTSVQYVYFGVFYHLTMKSRESLKTATIDGRSYTNVARSDFEIRNRSTGEITRFQMTYGTEGALKGVPLHAIYQPRWWFEVQLFLDERSTF
jgi:hypothetical protein